jgi:hypothetical protein
MPMSKSPQAYTDVHAVLETALSAERGVLLSFTTAGKAVNFRQRSYTYLGMLRKQNLAIYGESPQGNSCEFDELQIKVEGNSVFIKKRELPEIKIL